MATSTLFLAMSAASAIGTGISAIGSYQAQRAQSAVASANARTAREVASAEADRSRRAALRNRSSATASMGASGLLTSSGSSIATLQDMASQQAENELNILYGGEVNRANALNRSKAYRSGATASLIGGVASAGTGLLSSGYQYRREFPE